MGLFDGSKGFFLGFAVGFGTGAVMRDSLPHIRDAVSPLIKLSLKSVILVTEKSREMTSQFIEMVQDFVAEVVSELKESRKTAGPQARRQPSGKRKAPEPESAKVVSLGDRRDRRVVR